MENRTDLTRDEVVYISIIYHILDSWLNLLNDYDFDFYWRDSENQQQPIMCDLKMIPSPYYAIPVPQCLWVSVDGMQIDVIHYQPLTLSLWYFKFCPMVALIYNVVSSGKIRKTKLNKASHS